MKCTNYVVHTNLEKSLAVGLSPGECGTEMVRVGSFDIPRGETFHGAVSKNISSKTVKLYQCHNCKTIAIE